MAISDSGKAHFQLVRIICFEEGITDSISWKNTSDISFSYMERPLDSGVIACNSVKLWKRMVRDQMQKDLQNPTAMRHRLLYIYKLRCNGAGKEVLVVTVRFIIEKKDRFKTEWG